MYDDEEEQHEEKEEDRKTRTWKAKKNEELKRKGEKNNWKEKMWA